MGKLESVSCSLLSHSVWSYFVLSVTNEVFNLLLCPASIYAEQQYVYRLKSPFLVSKIKGSESSWV